MKSSYLITALLAWQLCPGDALAWTVRTGVTEGCHETITVAAYEDFILDYPFNIVPESNNPEWREANQYFMTWMPFFEGEMDDAKRFVLTSLIIGVREPDTDGHSVLNLENLRKLHGDPSAIGQYAHSLRGPDDDYNQGDVNAVEGTRQMILDLSDKAIEYMRLPKSEQLVKAQVYFDFYGMVEVEVWAPILYVGRAAHALQDTFAHTIRSEEDDLRKIVHVLNFVDAIGTNFDETRDGLAHADHMDECLAPDIQPLTDAATLATIDYIFAIREGLYGRDPDAVLHVLDKWVTLKEDCTLEDDLCGNSQWIDVARVKQTGPLISCSSSGHSAGWSILLVAFLLFFVLLRRGFGGHALLLILLVAFGQACDTSRDIFAEQERQRQRSNLITESLSFDGSSVVKGGWPEESPDGPRLEAFDCPWLMVPGRAFSLNLIIGPDVTGNAHSAVIGLPYGDRYLEIPLGTVPATGIVKLDGEIVSGCGCAGPEGRGFIALMGSDGSRGNQVAIPFNIVDEPSLLDFGLRVHAAQRRGIDAACFANGDDGTVMVSGGVEKIVSTVELRTGVRTSLLEGHQGRILCMDAAPNDSRVASGDSTGRVLIWDVASSQLLDELEDHTDFVKGVALAERESDGALLMASASWDNTVIVRNLDQPEVLNTFDAQARVSDVKLSANGRYLAAAIGTFLHGGQVTVWNLEDGSEVFVSPVQEREATAVALSGDATRVAASFGRGNIRAWDVGTGNELGNMDEGHTDFVFDMDFSPIFPHLLITASLSGYVTIWDTIEGKTALQGRNERVMTAIAFSPDGFYLAMGGIEGILALFNVADFPLGG